MHVYEECFSFSYGSWHNKLFRFYSVPLHIIKHLPYLIAATIAIKWLDAHNFFLFWARIDVLKMYVCKKKISSQSTCAFQKKKRLSSKKKSMEIHELKEIIIQSLKFEGKNSGTLMMIIIIIMFRLRFYFCFFLYKKLLYCHHLNHHHYQKNISSFFLK